MSDLSPGQEVKYHQRRLLVEWDVTIDDGDMVDALIRAIGGADA